MLLSVCLIKKIFKRTKLEPLASALFCRYSRCTGSQCSTFALLMSRPITEMQIVYHFATSILHSQEKMHFFAKKFAYIRKKAVPL